MKPATTITITIITETGIDADKCICQPEEPMGHDGMVRMFTEMLREELHRLDRREG